MRAALRKAITESVCGGSVPSRAVVRCAAAIGTMAAVVRCATASMVSMATRVVVTLGARVVALGPRVVAARTGMMAVTARVMVTS